MSGLVDKVREKVRSRSRSRNRKSGSLGGGRSEFDFGNNGNSGRASLDTSNRQALRGNGASPDPRQSSHALASGSPASPQRGRFGDINDNHTSAQQIRMVTDDPAAASRDTPSNLPSSPLQPGRAQDGIPQRRSSLNNSGRDNMQQSYGNVASSTGQALDGSRRASVSRKPVGSTATGFNRPSSGADGQATYGNASSQKSPTSATSTASGAMPGQRTAQSMDLAPNDPSPLIPRFSSRNNAQPTGTSQPATRSTITTSSRTEQVHERDEHLILPPGFPVGHQERTEVETSWRPAITDEQVLHQRTEIVREAIARDIHIHHYYTYTQPLKVVEVLPAIHYMLDEKTGQKVRIDAPAGWAMPANLTPRISHTDALMGSERHYVVDEQHPGGMPEAPPLRHKQDVDDMSLPVGHTNTLGQTRLVESTGRDHPALAKAAGYGNNGGLGQSSGYGQQGPGNNGGFNQSSGYEQQSRGYNQGTGLGENAGRTARAGEGHPTMMPRTV